MIRAAAAAAVSGTTSAAAEATAVKVVTAVYRAGHALFLAARTGVTGSLLLSGISSYHQYWYSYMSVIVVCVYSAIELLTLPRSAPQAQNHILSLRAAVLMLITLVFGLLVCCTMPHISQSRTVLCCCCCIGAMADALSLYVSVSGGAAVVRLLRAMFCSYQRNSCYNWCTRGCWLQ
jgi:hypothetical protein